MPLVIDFVSPSSLLRERDRPSQLPIVGNGPPGTFVVLPEGVKISLPTDQIVSADDGDGHARVAFGGMSFVGQQDGQLVFTRVREVLPEEELSPARSRVMKLDPAWVTSISEVRAERPSDVAAIRSINVAAFGRPAEADLVDRLRAEVSELISLVAEENGRIVGHILFSPVTLARSPDLNMMGLAPMAVAPTHQRRGFGSMLVREGLDECARRGYAAVVVLGHVAFYPRFGFVPASRFGLSCKWNVPEGAFMAVELVPNALRGRGGIVHYHDAFG
ncbi:MAG TPA: N-acetyltransferase [Vicinamibacterales bacterium]|nr:N-acetyltransferase [Vicinamibacterales bacterium]